MTPAPRWTRDPALDSILESLVPQAFYEIIWTDDSRRTDRRSVFSFMDRDNAREINDVTVWNGRPTVGTQTMPTKNILALRKLDKAEIAGKKREDLVVIDEKAPPSSELVWIACGNREPHAEHGMPSDGPNRDCRCPGIADEKLVEDGFRTIPQHCGSREPHEPHVRRVSREQRWKMVCAGQEDLTKSGDIGVRWQAQMEAHLDVVRKLTSEAMMVMMVQESAVVQGQGNTNPTRFRVELAKANASAALALAISNGISDLEPVLAWLAKPVTYMEGMDTTFGGPDGENRFVAAAIKAYRATERQS